MSQFDQLEVVHPDGAVIFYDLDPATGIVNIGHHPDNDIVLAGDRIRSFHALVDHRQQPYQLLWLDDESGYPEPLSPWQTFRVGEYELVLVHNGRIEAALSSSLPMTKPHILAATPAPVMPTSAAVAGRCQVAPGQAVAHTLTIHNSGSQNAGFMIEASGLPASWVHISPPSVQLQPGQQTQIQIVISPPPETAAAIHRLAWRIVSPQYLGWQQSEVVEVQIVGQRAVTWGAVMPDLIRSGFLRTSGVALLPLTNASSEPIAYRLLGKEMHGETRVRFEAAGVQITPPTEPRRAETLQTVYLPPHSTSLIKVIITPTERRFLGIRMQKSRVLIQGEPGVVGATQSATLSFEGHPALNMGYLLVLIMVMALVLLLLYRESVGAWVAGWLYPSATIQEMVAVAPTPTTDLPTPIARVALEGATGGQLLVNANATTYEAMFKEISYRYNLDWRVLAALAHRESRLNPLARGGSGEYGLMQILPATWNEWATLVEVDNPFDPYSNILVGAAYLSYLQTSLAEMGQPDLRWALAAYNWGPERVATLIDSNGSWYAIPVPQRQYVADILMGIDHAPGWVQAADSLLALMGWAQAA